MLPLMGINGFLELTADAETTFGFRGAMNDSGVKRYRRYGFGPLQPDDDFLTDFNVLQGHESHTVDGEIKNPDVQTLTLCR